MTMDMTKVEAFAGQVVTDVAATMSGVMTSIGGRLGLYKALAGAGKLTSTALADKAGLHERFVREWLNNQVAGGYVDYDAATSTYMLPDEHVPVLAVDDSPVYLVPALEVAASLWFDREKIEDCFRSGDGLGWHEHHESLFCGCEALFKPGYRTSLVADWVAGLDGVTNKLREGAKIADVGCGHGASAILLAQSFPKSQVIGIDSHEASIETARSRAIEEGAASDNLRFEVARADDYEGREFDLICFMDCLHDMGDPNAAARHAFQALKSGGTVLLVEPASNDGVENNINPVSRLYYAASTGICTPCSLSQDGRAGLGAQAGPARLSKVLEDAGFVNVRESNRTPFNIVLEARRP